MGMLREKVRRKTPKDKARISAWHRRRRLDPAKRAWCIVKDSRKSDKQSGRQNDLTIEFVDMMIENGCAYCGDDSIKMTLDRIDNSIGHIMMNVNPCCARCNYFRRDMPYTAWLELAPIIKGIRERGMLGDWACDARPR